MNRERVEATLAALASHPGVHGCALADAGSGMVLFHAGTQAGLEPMTEAAMELWRVHQRNAAHFAELGALQSAAYGFAGKVVALFPCTPGGLVLACVADKQGIAWAEWGERASQLRRLLA